MIIRPGGTPFAIGWIPGMGTIREGWGVQPYPKSRETGSSTSLQQTGQSQRKISLHSNLMGGYEMSSVFHLLQDPVLVHLCFGM